MCVCICLECVYVCNVHAVPSKALKFLEVKFQVVVSHPVDAGN